MIGLLAKFVVNIYCLAEPLVCQSEQEVLEKVVSTVDKHVEQTL